MASYHPLLQGAIELHCHSSPSIFERKQSDWELVADLKAAGMAGALLKAHESQTADRTALIRLQEPGLHIYGGLVCNYFTGGLSPYAVDVAIRLGAKCIWMPTISAQEHFDHFAKQKTKLFKSGRPVQQPAIGLRIWDDNRVLLPEVHEILNLIAEADIVLSTGHLSPPEVLALTTAAKAHNVQKILIQHADMGIAKVPLDMQKQLARMGAIVEKCYLACTSDFSDLTVAQMVSTMQEIGYASCVMVTDHGQPHNPSPVRALSDFVTQVVAAGVADTAIRQMIVENPRQLLGL